MLSSEEELSGYDLKKWADWSMRYIYGAPARSQIYTELKNLEHRGFATSRVHSDTATRGRRLYRITDAGRAAVTDWHGKAPIGQPMLKNHMIMRIMFGHLSTPERLTAILREHIVTVHHMERCAAVSAAAARIEPGWAYTQIVLQWAERYYAAQRSHAEQLVADIDALANDPAPVITI